MSSVHAARRAVLSRGGGSAAGSEEEEVESVLFQLKELGQLEECNDLDLVQRLKRALMQHVPAPAPAADSVGAVMGLNTRSGLDLVRKELLQEIQSCVSLTVNEADGSEEAAAMLLCTRHLCGSGKTSKKQKASGYFSFNFDDDQPLFEPLEMTLTLLRKDPLDAVALHKLMEIDVAELVEHPQWTELTGLLLSSLHHSWSASPLLPHSALSVHLHVRLMHGFEGEQRIDIAHNLLRHLWHCWIDQNGSTSGQAAIHIQSNLAIFVDVIQIALPQLQYCNSKQTDSFVATLFLLLARGSFILLTSPSPSPSSVLDFLSCENAASIKDVMRLRSTSVAVHAVTSSLLSVLHARLTAAQKALLANDSISSCTISRRFIVDACLFFGLSRPLCKMNHLRELACIGAIGSDFQWNGRMTCAAAAANEPALEVVPDANKFFSHLTCSSSMTGMLKIDACSPLNSIHHLELLLSCANALACIQRSDLSLQATKANGRPSIGVHTLTLLLLDHVTEYDLDHCISIIEALMQTITFIPTTSHLAPFLRALQCVSPGPNICIWTNLWISITEFALSCEGGYAPIAAILYATWNRHLQSQTAETFAGSSKEGSSRMIELLLLLAARSVECLTISACATPADPSTDELMLHFLAVLVCCDVMRNAFAGPRALLLQDIVCVLLRHVAAAGKGDMASSTLTASSAVDAVCSLLTTATEFGPATLTTCSAMADVIGELGLVFVRGDVWDCAHSHSLSFESQLPLWSLLCGMALSGHVEEAFELIVQASAPLRMHCQEMGVTSAADLAAAVDGEINARLSSEGMYPFLLRFLTVASCNQDFCLAILQRTIGPSARAAATTTSGLDFCSQFWSSLAARLDNIVPIAEEAGITTTEVSDTTDKKKFHLLALLGEPRNQLAKHVCALVERQAHLLAAEYCVGGEEGEDTTLADCLLSRAGIQEASIPILRRAFLVHQNGFRLQGRDLAWFIAASFELLQTAPAHDFDTLLSLVHVGHVSLDLADIHRRALSLVPPSQRGLFSAIGYPAHLLVRKIIREWFSGMLCSLDIAAVTAATLLAGPQEAALAVAAILDHLAQHVRQEVGAEPLAAAITSAFRSGSFHLK